VEAFEPAKRGVNKLPSSCSGAATALCGAQLVWRGSATCDD
jgi:hypothetical protein